MIKNASKWILSYSKIKFVEKFMAQDFEFELMSLSESNIEAVKLLNTSESIVELAANGGLAINKSRIIEDESLANSLAAYWKEDELKEFTDPTIMFQVGEKVCELSGLTSFLEEVLAYEENDEKDLAALLLEEEKEIAVNGDDLNNAHIIEIEAAVSNMDADAIQYQNNQNTNQ